MTIGTITEHGEPNPEPERDDPTLQAQAVTGLTTPADAGLQVHATATIMQLPTVSSDSFTVAALLTAISADLVLCGSAVLARTRFLNHSRARAAELLAAEKLQRHTDSLHHMLLLWALRSAAPEGVDHAKWDVALNHAIRALFSTTT